MALIQGNIVNLSRKSAQVCALVAAFVATLSFSCSDRVVVSEMDLKHSTECRPFIVDYRAYCTSWWDLDTGEARFKYLTTTTDAGAFFAVLESKISSRGWQLTEKKESQRSYVRTRPFPAPTEAGMKGNDVNTHAQVTLVTSGEVQVHLYLGKIRENRDSHGGK